LFLANSVNPIYNGSYINIIYLEYKQRMNPNDTQLGQGVSPENETNESNNMAALLEQEGLGIDFPNQGEIRDGVIASISPGQILVSVGTKSEGVISGKELEQIPEDEMQTFVVGKQIPVYVINPEDSSGTLVLSYVRAREEVSWKEAEDLLESKGVSHANIIGYNKGGLIVPLGVLRGFVPASQISLGRRAGIVGDTPDQRWGKMVGEDIDYVVIEVDRSRRRLILSERAASTETRETVKDRVILDINEGDIRRGRVTSLADFGAFININGADGLVHLSEISWERIKHPSEALEVGQDVDVKVISVDREKKRIGLSIRQLLNDPWSQIVENYTVGQLVSGVITRLTKFGAFARLEENLEGLIHISEISDRRIEHPKEVLTEGDEVTLRVIKIDPGDHRIGLSIRKVDSMAYADMDWKTLLEDEEGVTVVTAADQAEEAPKEKASKAPKAPKAPKAEKVEAPEEVAAPEVSEDTTEKE
jgi:small subunit ribosomal protein S1